MLNLDPVPKVISFDCYGTLVQWHRALKDAADMIVAAHLPKRDTDGQASGLADRLRALAVEHQQRLSFCDYRSVLHASLEQSLAEAGIPRHSTTMRR